MTVRGNRTPDPISRLLDPGFDPGWGNKSQAQQDLIEFGCDGVFTKKEAKILAYDGLDLKAIREARHDVQNKKTNVTSTGFISDDEAFDIELNNAARRGILEGRTSSVVSVGPPGDWEWIQAEAPIISIVPNDLSGK